MNTKAKQEVNNVDTAQTREDEQNNKENNKDGKTRRI